MNSDVDSHEVRVGCPRCGQEGHAFFGQTVPDGRLRWYHSVHCPATGYFEVDGVGLGAAPLDLRAKLIAATGIWSVRADETEKLKAIATAKRVLPEPLANAAPLLQAFPTLFQGTKFEANWLMEKLTKEGINGEVLQTACGG